MRNRAIEIHLPVTPTSSQDQLRIQDVVRVPFVQGTPQDMIAVIVATHFDLLRRGHSYFQLPDLVSVSGIDGVSYKALWLLKYWIRLRSDIYIALTIRILRTHIHFFSSACLLRPPYMPVIRRLLSMPLSCSSYVEILDTLLEGVVSHLRVLRQSVGERISQIRGVPSSFISGQVSTNLHLPSFLPDSCFLRLMSLTESQI